MVDADGVITARLQDDFPNWDVSRSRNSAGKPGGWSATRNHVLNGAEMGAGLLHQLQADTARDLRAALAEQARIEADVNKAKDRARELGFPTPARSM